jgi:UDP-glucose 4-epimerase
MKKLIVRPSSIYGPGMKRGAIINFATQLRTHNQLVIGAEGSFQADYVWYEDVADLIVKAICSDKTGVVNVGSGEAQSLASLAYMLAEVLHANPELVRIKPSVLDGVPAGFSAVDIRRARRWFDYRPLLLRTGLERWLSRCEIC